MEVTVEEEDLRSLFGRYGVLDPNDGVILFRRDIPGYTNYAHINYTNRDDAATARAKLNFFELHGRNLRVEWNRSPKKLLDSLAQHSSMQQLGGIEGDADASNTNDASKLDTQPPRTRSSSVSSMEHDGQQTGQIKTASIIVDKNHAQQQSVPTTPRTSNTYICQPVISVYVQFETIGEDVRVSEGVIREVFDKFGHVTGCFIKSNFVSNNGKRQYGYAFVHFESSQKGQESAQNAAETIGYGNTGVDGKTYPYEFSGVLYKCEVSKNYRRATGVLVEDAIDPSSYDSNGKHSHQQVTYGDRNSPFNGYPTSDSAKRYYQRQQQFSSYDNLHYLSSKSNGMSSKSGSYDPADTSLNLHGANHGGYYSHPTTPRGYNTPNAPRTPTMYHHSYASSPSTAAAAKNTPSTAASYSPASTAGYDSVNRMSSLHRFPSVPPLRLSGLSNESAPMMNSPAAVYFDQYGNPVPMYHTPQQTPVYSPQQCNETFPAPGADNGPPYPLAYTMHSMPGNNGGSSPGNNWSQAPFATMPFAYMCPLPGGGSPVPTTPGVSATQLGNTVYYTHPPNIMNAASADAGGDQKHPSDPQWLQQNGDSLMGSAFANKPRPINVGSPSFANGTAPLMMSQTPYYPYMQSSTPAAGAGGAYYHSNDNLSAMTNGGQPFYPPPQNYQQPPSQYSPHMQQQQSQVQEPHQQSDGMTNYANQQPMYYYGCANSPPAQSPPVDPSIGSANNAAQDSTQAQVPQASILSPQQAYQYWQLHQLMMQQQQQVEQQQQQQRLASVPAGEPESGSNQ